MDVNQKYSPALVGVLIEASKQGIDIDTIYTTVHAGLMSNEPYAPAGTTQKTDETSLLKESLAYAKELITIL